MPILGLRESAEEATKLFRTFEAGKPDLIPTGMRAIDGVLGGLFPGVVGILAAATGAGKSSLMLAAALASPTPVGIVSLEDTPDVIGGRALAWASGVDSLKLRTKDLSPADYKALKSALPKLASTQVKVAYEIGASLERVRETIRSLAESGCRLIWVDYIQKIRGVREDRRNEISTAFGGIQAECAAVGAAAFVVSQFSRQPDPSREPQIYWLKESGDLENEARLIVLSHKDADNPELFHSRLAKSTVGGEGLRFVMRRDASGTLQEIEHDDEF